MKPEWTPGLAAAALGGLLLAGGVFVSAMHRAATVEAAGATIDHGSAVEAFVEARHQSQPVQNEADLLVTAELDPFRPERAPPPAVVAPEIEQPSTEPAPRDVGGAAVALRLFGTTIGGGRASALIGGAGIPSRVVHVGDSMDIFRVHRIGQAEAVLVSTDTVLVLSLTPLKRN